jgi:hypothetical protein
MEATPKCAPAAVPPMKSIVGSRSTARGSFSTRHRDVRERKDLPATMTYVLAIGGCKKVQGVMPMTVMVFNSATRSVSDGTGFGIADEQCLDLKSSR